MFASTALATLALFIPAYRITALEESGYSFSFVTAISDSGEVVGFGSGPSGGQRALLWKEGKIRALQEVPDTCLAEARGISSGGVIAGECDGRAGEIGLVWTGDGVQVLAPLPQHKESHVYAISSAGLVVGESGQWYRGRACLWSNGVASDLGVLPGDSWSRARAISAKGVIVGVSGDKTFRAFKVLDGRMLPLALPAGTRFSAANAINDSGQIVGFSDNRAALWLGENVELLPGMKGFPESVANSINDKGEIVGKIGPRVPKVGDGPIPDELFQSVAVLWKDGKVINLTRIAAQADPKIWLFDATGINGSGSIICEGRVGRGFHCYLLTPT